MVERIRATATYVRAKRVDAAIIGAVISSPPSWPVRTRCSSEPGQARCSSQGTYRGRADVEVAVDQHARDTVQPATSRSSCPSSSQAACGSSSARTAARTSSGTPGRRTARTASSPPPGREPRPPSHPVLRRTPRTAGSGSALSNVSVPGDQVVRETTAGRVPAAIAQERTGPPRGRASARRWGGSRCGDQHLGHPLQMA